MSSVTLAEIFAQLRGAGHGAGSSAGTAMDTGSRFGVGFGAGNSEGYGMSFCGCGEGTGIDWCRRNTLAY